MRSRSLIVLILMALCVGLVVVGFSQSRDTKYTFYAVGVSPGVDPFFAMVLKGFEAAEEVFPVDVHYIGLSAGELNPTGLVTQLETAKAAMPDGLITGFWMAAAEDDVVRAMISAGIPVIAINQNDTRPPDERIPYLSYVGQDETETGQALAKATLARMDVTRAIIGIHVPGSASLEIRANGIAEVLEGNGIPYDKLDITADPSTAISVMGAYLMQHPDTNVIFTLGPTGTHPSLSLLQEQGLGGKVVISTFDVTNKTIEGIKDGRILLTVSQQPFMQSFTAVQLLYMYLEYGIVPPAHIPTGPTMIDKNNVEIIEKQVKMTGGA